MFDYKHTFAAVHIVEFNWSERLPRDCGTVDLRTAFASNFEYYLQAEKGLPINSSGKILKSLKKVIRDCVDKDWLDRDPFYRFKVRHVDPKVPHLSASELKAIEEKDIVIKGLLVVSDLFVFSCYTGFAYVDVANLTADHLKIDENICQINL